VFSGDVASALPQIALGADGLVSVCANEVPKETAKLVEHALNGSFHFARKIHYKLLPLIEANFIESSPAPCKCVMKEMGLLEESLRLPLVKVSNESRSRLRSIIDKVMK
jgi:4-hydroxy-tetrahydrodipicolinate synthase